MRRRPTAVLAASGVILLAIVTIVVGWSVSDRTVPRANHIRDSVTGIGIVAADDGGLAPVPPDFAEGVLGTAEIAPNDAGVSGSLSFVLDGGDLFMRVDDLALTPLDSYNISLLAVRVDPAERCVDSGYHETFATGAPEVGQNEFPLGPLDDYWRGDPTYLDAAVITQHVDGSSCVLDRIAYAPILWSFNRSIPTIDVNDSGVRNAASGEVFSPEGVPVRYRIAPGDEMFAIAARLGVGYEELDWLNPRLLYPVAGRDLNLDPLNR